MDMNDVSLLFAKMLKRVPGANRFACKYNMHRHEKLMQRIEANALQAFELSSVAGENSVNNGPIWVFWWQGIDNASSRVKACISSIRRNSNGRQVIVITQSNVHEYTSLPDYIFSKLADGNITLTHFSDILRFNLLHLHGGMWMDATLYVAKPLTSIRYSGSFFTCSGYSDPTFFNVSDGKWTGFFIGGSKNESLFAFMNQFFLDYWKNNDQLIDYFLIDYALEYAYDHEIGSLRSWCENERGQDNPALFELAPIVSEPFDEEKWLELTEKTDVFKLSWKKPASYPDGSFGDYLISSENTDESGRITQ